MLRFSHIFRFSEQIQNGRVHRRHIHICTKHLNRGATNRNFHSIIGAFGYYYLPQTMTLPCVIFLLERSTYSPLSSPLPSPNFNNTAFADATPICTFKVAIPIYFKSRLTYHYRLIYPQLIFHILSPDSLQR